MEKYLSAAGAHRRAGDGRRAAAQADRGGVQPALQESSPDRSEQRRGDPPLRFRCRLRAQDRPARAAREGCRAGHAGPVGRRETGAHDANRDQALGARVLQPVSRKSGFACRCRKAITRFGSGFIDDPFVKTLAKEDIYKDTVNKWIGAVTVIGPFKSQGEKPSRERVLVCDPSTGPRCVDRILTALARRAYRRPVTGAEVAALRKFVALAESEGQSVEQGIALAIQAMLVSPHFLFHIERDLYPTDPTRAHRISDVELASRLSYFLWNSMPDEELLSLAERRRLSAASCARCAGDADDRRPEGRGDGGELCRPVARGSQSRQHQARPAEVSGLDTRAARCHEGRDADVLPRDAARQPSDQRVHRRALHVPQRAAGDALRHRWRHRTGVPARRAHDRASAAVC